MLTRPALDLPTAPPPPGRRAGAEPAPRPPAATAGGLLPEDLVEALALRRALHRAPELAGREAATARAVAAFLAPTRPDALLTGLGGHGIAAVYAGAAPGPTVMLRAELDAVPVQEVSDAPHRSGAPGVAHLCGHDGHCAALGAVARAAGRERPARGRLVLLFQPAEEDGSGAAAVIADPRFAAIAPDLAFAYHNMPGLPFGVAALAEGPVACASRGLRIGLLGRAAHASQPETGRSPVAAMMRLAAALAALGGDDRRADGAPGQGLGPGFAMATVTHARVGEPAFGVAPGHAELWVTLRTLTDDRMGALLARAEAAAREAAAADGLELTLGHEDVFDHVENAPEAVAHLRRALDAEGVARDAPGQPMRPSEDFGRFGKGGSGKGGSGKGGSGKGAASGAGPGARAALFLLGAGEAHPALHNPDYDFPDALTGIAARVLLRAARDLLG